MKKLLFYLLFFALSTQVNAQIRTVNLHSNPLSFNASDTVTYAFDTIKVRIMLDDCNMCLLTVINGYLVRKFISYGRQVHPLSNKLYSEFKYMDEDYKVINNDRVWSWREKTWKSNGRSVEFLTPRMIW